MYKMKSTSLNNHKICYRHAKQCHNMINFNLMTTAQEKINILITVIMAINTQPWEQLASVNKPKNQVILER